MHPIVQRLKERKLVQWGLAYLAGAWMATQILDVLREPWGLSADFVRTVQLLLLLGFLVALVLAWYHGERGEQRITWTEGLILAVVLGFGALFVASAGGRGEGGAVARSDARRLLVIPPHNLTGVAELDAWGVLAADAMTRAVTQHTELDVVAMSEARRIFGQEEPTVDAVVSGLAAAGASHALSSSYVRLGGTLQINAEVLDGADGTVLRTLAPIAFPEDSLGLGLRRLEEAIGVAAISLEAYNGWILRLLSQPSTTEGARLMIQAREAMCATEQEGAVRLAERALALEPDWPSPYLTLRPLLFNLERPGEWESEDEEALLQLLPRMTEFERQSWEFMEGATTQDRLRGAVGGFRLTGGDSPFNQGYAVAFRALQLNYLDLAREGMNTIGSADGPCAVSWNYRWVVDGQLYHLAGDFESELRTLREGQERAPTEVMFVRDEIGALAALDRVQDISQRLNRLESLPSPPDSIWNALHDVGLELFVHGHEARSNEALNRLVAWGQAHELSPLQQGHALYDAGRYDEAEPLLSAALREAVTGAGLGLLAMTLDRLGRSEEADELVTQLDAGEGVVFYGDHAPEEFPASRWPTIVAASRGELDRAVSLLRTALERGLRYYDLNQMQIHIRPELIPLQDHPGFRELMAPRPYVDSVVR